MVRKIKTNKQGQVVVPFGRTTITNYTFERKVGGKNIEYVESYLEYDGYGDYGTYNEVYEVIFENGTKKRFHLIKLVNIDNLPEEEFKTVTKVGYILDYKSSTTDNLDGFSILKKL